MLDFSDKGAPINWYNFRGLRHKKKGAGKFRGPGSKIVGGATEPPHPPAVAPLVLLTCGALALVAKAELLLHGSKPLSKRTWA